MTASVTVTDRQWVAKSICDADLFWLAGLLEGEGSFQKGPPSAPNRPLVALKMTDQDVVKRVADLFGLTHVTLSDRRNDRWKPYYTVQLRGRGAIELMTVLRPLMGQRRRLQIDSAVASWQPRQARIDRAKAAAIMESYRAGESAKSLAERYGVTKRSIYAIKQGRYFSAATAMPD